MYNYNNYDLYNNNDNANTPMYPAEYDRFMPIAEEVVREMENRHGNSNIYLDADMLNQMVGEAVRRSRSADMDMNIKMDKNMDAGMREEEDSEAVQTVLDVGRRPTVIGPEHGHDHGYDYDHHHKPDPLPLSDIYKILILQQLFGGRYYRRHGGGRRRR